MWPNTFDERLLEWRELRQQSKTMDLQEMLVHVDTWWQQAPLTTHYLHIVDADSWPGPWDLLADNIYCDLAKCLGICYTIVLLERDDIKNLRIIETDNYFLVEVNNEHILNYYPREIVNKDTIQDFKIKYAVNADTLCVE